MGSMGSSSDKNLMTTAVAVVAVVGLAGGITSSLRRHGQIPPPYYEKCENVWDVLERPITRFDPGHREGLDHDKDGIACEYDPRKKKP